MTLSLKSRGALELSISTIVVIVLSVTMLIIGLVFVRNIMCGSIGLTGDINEKVRGEITRLFGSSEGEVQCIGSGGEPVQMIPGKLNIIWCAINAKQTGNYKIVATSIEADGVPQNSIDKWMVGSTTWEGTVAPGDSTPKKIIRMNIPDNAPEGSVRIDIDITKNGLPLTTQSLDFSVQREGLVRTSVC